MLLVTNKIRIPDSELQFTFSRSGGPGGQNVNKVNTKATLHWPVAVSEALPDDVRRRFQTRFRRRINQEGQLVLASQRYRDRERNVQDCLAKLRDLIREVAEPPKPRRATRPTRGSVERRLRSKRHRAEAKQRRQPPSRD